MSSDRIVALAQRQSGNVLELIGKALVNQQLERKGRALRAHAGLRDAIGSAKLALLRHAR